MATAESTSVRLHYEISGSAHREALVLINSLGSSLKMWDKVVPAFEKRFTVVRFDIRGHGDSWSTPGHYTIDQLGRDVLFLLDELGLLRVNLCGLSLGGMIAMWLGIHAPDRILKIVLANTAARIGTVDGWDRRIDEVQAGGMRPIASAAVDRWFTSSYRDQHPMEMELIEGMIAATSPDSYASCCRVLRDTDLSAQLSSINAQCLVIGGAHDPATPLSDAHALQRALPRSKYVELDASHLSAWERHEEFSQAVLSFLSEKEYSHG